MTEKKKEKSTVKSARRVFSCESSFRRYSILFGDLGHPHDVPSTSSPVVGPPRLRKRTPTPLRSTGVGETTAGAADESAIPVAALNSVELFCSEEEGATKSWVVVDDVVHTDDDVVVVFSSPLQSIASCILDGKICRLAFGMKAVEI